MSLLQTVCIDDIFRIGYELKAVVILGNLRPMAEQQAFYTELGHRIREAREKSHLTQEALAKMVSLTRTSVTNIEKGRQQLLVHTLVEIAKALKVSPESLLPQTQSIGVEVFDELDELLKGHSPQEKEWIKATIDTVSRK
jgi:transcriptional regulator with XRE-family HTH domain